jgi:hypothetical protein
LLAGALAVVIALAVHYHGQVVALRHQLRTPRASHPARTIIPTFSISTVALPPHRALNGTVTVVAANTSTGRARVMLSVRITGGSPDTTYSLIAFDCTGVSGYQTWAVGTTDERGAAVLSGRTWPVLLNHKFWLYLSPTGGSFGSGSLLGTFSATGRFNASVAGDPACS